MESRTINDDFSSYAFWKQNHDEVQLLGKLLESLGSFKAIKV